MGDRKDILDQNSKWLKTLSLQKILAKILTRNWIKRAILNSFYLNKIDLQQYLDQ